MAMVRPRATVAVPAGGLSAALLALVLWVAAAPLPRLDAVALALLGAGLALSILGYATGTTVTARRLGVVGIGVSAFGAALVCWLAFGYR